MSATYTGVGAHVLQSTSPVIQEPSDLDDDNAATFTPGLRALLDNVALIWRGEFHGTTSSSPGLIGVGGSTAPGVIAQAGGTNRGSLNLVPQAAPSGPSDGDIWIETVSNLMKAQISGATHQIVDTNYVETVFTGEAHTWALKQTFSAGLDSGGTKITGLATPTVGTDASTKAYVDSTVPVIHRGSDTQTLPNPWAPGAIATWFPSVPGAVPGQSIAFSYSKVDMPSDLIWTVVITTTDAVQVTARNGGSTTYTFAATNVTVYVATF